MSQRSTAAEDASEFLKLIANKLPADDEARAYDLARRLRAEHGPVPHEPDQYPPEEEPAVPTGEWRCGHCSFRNSGWAKFCMSCGTKRG